MLAKEPRQRYPDCSSVLSDIRAVLAGQEPALEINSGTTHRMMWARWAALAALLVLVGWLVTKLNSNGPTVSASSRQLVVLPFKPAVDDAANRAFASGLTETLAAKLGQIADRYPLEIVPASEVRAQKVKNAEQARTILGATLVLEGSMQQAGSTVRVTYSLVDTRKLRQLHSGVITADAANSFAVQDRVIEEVLNRLDIELAKNDRGRMQSHGTAQPQAYESYLSGRGYLQEYDRLDSLDSAITAFQRSIQLDHSFTLAYSGLGQAYIQRFLITHSNESVAQAKDACSQAAKLDRSAPDADICLGLLFNSTGEYEKAAQQLERAVELDDSRDEAYRALGLAYEKMKRLQDAESLLKRAIVVRPQYWGGYKYLGKFYDTQGRYSEAILQYKRVVELAPDSYSGYSNLGGVYLHLGNYTAAIAELERSIAIRPTASALSNLGVAYFYQHRYEDAARNYELAAQTLPGAYAIFGNLGEAYAQIADKGTESRGNYAHALELAERGLAVNPRDGGTLMDAALYAAVLAQTAKADTYRKAGLRFSSNTPEIRLGSALVLAQLHKDKAALAELDKAFQYGLSASNVANNPAWERFAVYPEFVAMMTRAQSKK
jgi:tetratricopeptide (TPR) repeat protein